MQIRDKFAEESEDATREQMLEVIQELEVDGLIVDMYISHISAPGAEPVVALYLSSALDKIEALIEILQILKEKNHARGN